MVEGGRFMLGDLIIVHRYLVAMSFISAFWHLSGDLGRRDRAAQTASILVGGLGLDPEAVMLRLLRYEETWEAGLTSAGLRSRPVD